MPARDLVGPAAALLLLGLGLQGLHRDPALGLHAVGVQFAAAGAGGRVSVELFHRVRARLHPLAVRLLGARRRCDDEQQQRRPDFHRTLPARKPRPSRRGGAPISMADSPRELSTRSASGPGDNQAVGPLRQPSKRRWGWTGRLRRSRAGRRTVNLEPQGQALGFKHGLLSLKAPDFSPGDVYARYSISTTLQGRDRTLRPVVARADGATAAQPPAHYRTGADGVILPDSSATPGATRPVTVSDLCPIAHTRRVRHVTPAQKHRAYAVYGATPKQGVCCEVDHLIPLELGGSN